MKRLFSCFALGVVALVSWAPASAQYIHQCDVLVSHPLDPDRVIAGVPSSQVNHPAGIAACTAAVEAEPDNPRFQYQLGRVYFYDGQSEKALPHLEKAAAAGYRQAMFVLGYVLDSGLGGVSPDVCRTEDLWARAARAGRLAAMVSYPHHVVRGRFDACKVQLSKAEMMGLLEQAKARRLDYYQGVLVADIIMDLAGYKP